MKALTLLAGLLAAGLLVLGVHAADVETAAKVVASDGQVSVLRNGELWVLNPEMLVRVGETIVTGPQGYARLQIYDGSTFDVYPSSRVVFRANPGNLRELLEVFLGKIKVHIQTFGGRPNPYKIHSPTAVIAVRGTIFEVGVEDDTVTSVSVDEGEVEVQHRLLPGKTVPLLPGQSLRVFPNAALAAARIDKMSIAIRVANAARDALYTLPRINGGRTPTTRPGGGLPTDTPAPAPPAQPTDQSAPAPPPPPPGNP